MKYLGSKKVLIGAVALALCGNVAAAVDMADSTTALKYASEIRTDDTTAVILTAPGDGQVFTGAMDFKSLVNTALLSGKDYFFRFELSAGEWDSTGVANFAAQFVDTSGGTTAATVAPYLSPTGNQAFIIGITPGATINSTASVQIDVNKSVAVGNVVKSSATRPLASGSSVSISYTVHETQSSANGQNNALLASGSGAYFNMAGNIVKFTQTPSTQPLIDVANGSLTFVGTPAVTTAELCALALTENSVALKDGTLVTATSAVIDGVAAGTKLVLRGAFDAVSEGGLFTATAAKDRVFLSDDACATMITGGAADALTATEASFTLDTLPLDGVSTGTTVNVCMTVNGVTSIPVSKYTATYTPVSATGFNMPENMVDCNELSKGGSSAEIPLVLSAASQWSNLMRISNPSGIGGNVHIYAYNDNGLKAGPWSIYLNAGQSTGLITVQQIIDNTGAAPLVDAATIGTGKLNKLRLHVEAEFGDNNSPTAVQVRSYVLPDATSGTFTQFQ